jgi:hypothetical protein
MIDQMVMMSMQLTSEFAGKANLNEFEHQMYESMCRMISSHCTSVRLANELNNIELERDLTIRREYEDNERAKPES